MPLVALNEEAKNRVCILDYPNPRGQFQNNSLVCPLCSERMIVVAGLVRTPHFRHYVECRNSDYERHPESPEHLEAKAELATLLKTKYAEYSIADLQLEVPLPEVRRIADVLITFPMGWRVAHEIQLSPITVEKLKQRSDDYRRAGVDVVWWLGRHANTETNRLYCQQNFGDCYLVDFETEVQTEVI